MERKSNTHLLPLATRKDYWNLWTEISISHISYHDAKAGLSYEFRIKFMEFDLFEFWDVTLSIEKFPWQLTFLIMH